MTAIIGKNGAGKSNLLYAIYKNFEILWNKIVVFYDKNREVFKIFIKPENNQIIDFFIYGVDKSPSELIEGLEIDFFEKTIAGDKFIAGYDKEVKNEITFAYYSLDFSNYADDAYYENYQTDLSFFRFVYEKAIKEYVKMLNDQYTKELTTFDFILQMNIDEQVIGVIQESEFLPDDLSTPNEINIVLHPIKLFIREWMIAVEHKEETKGTPLFQKGTKRYKQVTRLANLIYETYKDSSYSDRIKVYIILNSVFRLFEETDFDRFFHYLEDMLKDNGLLNQIFNEILNENEKNFTNYMISLHKNYCFAGDLFDIQIPINEFKLSMFDVYKNISYTGNKVLNLTFDVKMSSGEQNYLFMFSQLDQLVGNTNNDLYLLIDEGETSLHPDWQKRFVNLLLEYVKKRFPDNRLHIFLSSHSPFILSDIPESNVVFLDKYENGNCKVVDGLKEKKQTFGANIHTLLSDGFFMDDGLMGEFAKSKIEEVIDYLNDKESKIKDNDEAQKLINIIGEPIIKNQLQKMLDSKRLTKIDEIDSIKIEISDLEKRLKDIENANNKS